MIVAIDGCCKGNPGPGGWGIAFETGETLCGGSPATTNNRMELQALCELLDVMAKGVTVSTIQIDSKYVCKGVLEWLDGWVANNWINSQRKSVVNSDLWKYIDARRHLLEDVEIEWVKGHSGHALNDAADAAANKGVAPYL